jgi:hypothetical protein
MFLYIALANASPNDLVLAVISLVVAPLAGIASLLQWRGSRHKALSYEIVTDAPLTSLEKELRGIQFDADRVKDT